MAKIRDVATTVVSTATATPTVTMPTHQSGDLLLAFHSIRDQVTITPGGSWSSEQEESWSLNTGEVFSLVASGSSETYAPTLSLSKTQVIFVVSITGFHATNKVEATGSLSFVFQDPKGAPITTVSNNALVFQLYYELGSNGGLLSDGWQYLGGGEVAGTNAASLHVTTKATAGVVTPPTGITQQLGYSLAIAVAVADDGTSGEIPAYIQNDVTPGRMLDSLSGGVAQGNSFPGSLGISGVGSKTATYDALGSTADRNLHPFWSSGSITPAQNSAGTVVAGPELLFGTAENLSGGLVIAAWDYEQPLRKLQISTATDVGGTGIQFVTRDATDYKSWTIATNGDLSSKNDARNYAIIQVDQSTDTTYASSGTPDSSAIDAMLMLSSSVYGATQIIWNATFFVDKYAIAGGSSSNPLTYEEVNSCINGGLYPLSAAQVAGAATTYLGPIQFGGTSPLSIAINGKVFQLPTAADNVDYFSWHVDDDAVGFEFIGGASDNLNFANCTFVSGSGGYWKIASGYNPATDNFTGVSVSGLTVTLQSGFEATQMSFVDCSLITQNNAAIASCNFTNSTLLSDNPADIGNSSFTSGGTGHAIEIDTAGTYAFEGNSFTGYGADGSTDAAIYNNSGGAVTLNLAQGDSTPTVRNGTGASTTVNAYVDTLTVTSSESGSLIQVFTTNTQTILDSTTGTSLAYDHSAETVDIVVQKAGFIPQRRTGIALSGSPTQAFELVADPAYNASHGLTITTDYSYNATTRVLTIVAAQQGRDLYSALIDAFISETAYRNRPFPITAIGIDRFDFTSDGTTAATIDSGDIQYWRGAGMEWEHATTGNVTHKFCSVVGTGTNASGTKGYYQQVDGASPTALTLVSNNINQVIQYYSDPNGDGSVADGYDRSGHLVVKLFNDGYYQASANILTAYDVSAVESYEYVVPMQMTETGLGTGDRSLTLTVTDNTPAGVEEQTGYTFDYKIEGGASDSPEDILRQWIYDVYTDPTASTYASKINFNWPDPILETGGNYETKRGIVYGQDTTTTLHGFYVEEGTDYHPDFTRQQSNDGTYFVPDVTANISITGMPTDGANIRLQVANVTAEGASAWEATTAYSVGDIVLRTTGAGSEQVGGLFMRCATAGTTGGTEPTWDTTIGNTTSDGSAVWTTYGILYYDGDPASSAYSSNYIDGEEFSSGESYRINFSELNGATSFKTYRTTGVAASSGFSVVASVEAESVYASNAVNGSTTTQFTADYTNDEVDLSADADFSAAQAFAFYCYTLTTSLGMYNFWGGVTAIDAGNYRINTATLSLKFDNTTTGSVKQTDTARIWRDDGAYPVKDPTTSGYGVQVNWANQVYLETTGSVLTASQQSQLAAAAGCSTHSAQDVVDELMAEVMEGSETFKEQQNIIRAQSAGKVSVSGATVTFRDASDSKARITATVDANGQRTAVTTDGA